MYDNYKFVFDGEIISEVNVDKNDMDYDFMVDVAFFMREWKIAVDVYCNGKKIY